MNYAMCTLPSVTGFSEIFQENLKHALKRPPITARPSPTSVKSHIAFWHTLKGAIRDLLDVHL